MLVARITSPYLIIYRRDSGTRCHLKKPGRPYGTACHVSPARAAHTQTDRHSLRILIIQAAKLKVSELKTYNKRMV